jgi:hypothetical protein
LSCGKRFGRVLPGLRRCWTFVWFDTLVALADGLDRNGVSYSRGPELLWLHVKIFAVTRQFMKYCIHRG